MTQLYYVVVFVHVLAALVWLGGMLFFAIVAPVLRRVEDEKLRAMIFEALGRRFRAVGWICVALLLTTGTIQLWMRGWWGGAYWGRDEVTSSPLGVALISKLTIVLLMVVIQGIHDFRLGPRAGAATPGTPEARSLRIRAARLARLNVVLGLVLIYLAVRVARGG